MDNQKAIQCIPEYLDGHLSENDRLAFEKLLAESETLRREVALFQKSWSALAQWKDIEPDPAFVSRFWTEVTLRQAGGAGIWQKVKGLFSLPRLVPVVVTAVILIVGIISFNNMSAYKDKSGPARLAENNSKEIIEMAENLDIAQGVEFLEDMEMLENWEILEHWDMIEALS